MASRQLPTSSCQEQALREGEPGRGNMAAHMRMVEERVAVPTQENENGREMQRKADKRADGFQVDVAHLKRKVEDMRMEDAPNVKSMEENPIWRVVAFLGRPTEGVSTGVAQAGTGWGGEASPSEKGMVGPSGGAGAALEQQLGLFSTLVRGDWENQMQ